MSPNERWAYLRALDDELLGGGVVLSEWCTFIVREADTAFAHEAFLSAVLTAVAGIETYLRSEYSVTGKERLVTLVDEARLADDLKGDLHTLRKYRNRWVHVDDPWNDAHLIAHPDDTERELEAMALLALRSLRRTIYENQWI